MKKYQQIVLTISALIVASAVGYYFTLFLPNQVRADELGCAQAANTVKQAYISGGYEANNNDVLHVQNHYSDSQKTCFVEVEDLACGQQFCSTDATIFDGIENRPLAECVTTSDNSDSICHIPLLNGHAGSLSKEQFDALVQKDMTN